mgnify:CR=1 FL=1
MSTMTISRIYTTVPDQDCSPVQQEVLHLLEKLHIPFQYVSHDPANTMEDCKAISEALNVAVCKNLFLCNRQQTEFYLLCMPADKPFKTKDVTAQLGCARLSFATPEHMMDLLGAAPGSASAFELMHDKEGKVQLVIDRELMEGDFISGHPCFSTSTLKLTRSDFLGRFLPAVGHKPILVDLPWPEPETEV